MTKTFPNQLRAEKFLEENGFVWHNGTCEWLDEKGRNASLVDYGHKVVIEIWGE